MKLPYLIIVIVMLASIGEGYSFITLSQVLPEIQRELHLSNKYLGYLASSANLGGVFAFILAFFSDKFGRRKMLLLAALMYPCFNLLSGFSNTYFHLATMQFLSRLFSELQIIVLTVYLIETAAQNYRGTLVNLLVIFSAIGSIIGAVVSPFLIHSALNWRLVFFFGFSPIILLPFIYIYCHETHATTINKIKKSHMWASLFKYRNKAMLVASIWFIFYISVNSVLTFFKQHAAIDLGKTNLEIGLIIAYGSAISLCLSFITLRLIDIVGRIKSFCIYIPLLFISTFILYSYKDNLLLIISLTIALSSTINVLAILSTISAELFPEHIRNTLLGVCKSLFGGIGKAISPILISVLSIEFGWATSVRIALLGLFVVLVLTLVFIPETSKKDLRQN